VVFYQNVKLKLDRKKYDAKYEYEKVQICFLWFAQKRWKGTAIIRPFRQ
jgi:hypothetical protein